MSDCVNTRTVYVIDYIAFCEEKIKFFNNTLAEWAIQYQELKEQYSKYNRLQKWWYEDPRCARLTSRWFDFHQNKYWKHRNLKHWENELKQAMYLGYTINEQLIQITIDSQFWDSVTPEAY